MHMSCASSLGIRQKRRPSAPLLSISLLVACVCACVCVRVRLCEQLLYPAEAPPQGPLLSISLLVACVCVSVCVNDVGSAFHTTVG